jgi:hypothetical protein
VKEIWSRRIGQAAVRYGEQAPTATACCNACRTCVQTNLLGLALAAAAGGSLAIRRAVQRLRARA